MSKECPKLPVMYNMSIFKKLNSWTMDEVPEKEVDIRRLKCNEVIFEANFSKHIS